MSSKTDISTRALIVTLRSPIGGKTSKEIAAITGVPKRTVDSIYARAIQHGFKPNQLPLTIKDDILRDSPRSGRPKK